MLAQLLRPERAVEPDDQRVGVADAVPERLDRLPGQRPSGRVDDRPGHDDRQPLAELVEQGLDAEDRGLRVERVEDRLDQQDVGAALDQAGRRVVVGLLQLDPADGPGRRVAHVRADRRGPVGGAEGTRDEPRPTGVAGFGGVGGGARQSGGRDVEVADDRVVEPVVGLGDPGGGEGVGRDDVRAGVQVGRVHGPDRVGLRQRQEIVVAAQVAGMLAEAVAPVARLIELVRLEHRAHRAVEDEDAFREQTGEPGTPARARERRGGVRLGRVAARSAAATGCGSTQAAPGCAAQRRDTARGPGRPGRFEGAPKGVSLISQEDLPGFGTLPTSRR